MDNDSDNEIFITQSKYTDDLDSDHIIEGLLDSETPNMNIKLDFFSDVSDFEADETTIQTPPPLANSETEFDDGADKLLVETENAASSQTTNLPRFANPLTTEDITNLVNGVVPKNTTKKSKWAVGLFENWRKQRNSIVQPEDTIDGDLLTLSNADLNKALSFFIGEVRNQSGKDYNPKTLYEIIIALQHDLRLNDRLVNFLEDKVFLGMRSVLDARMKELSRKGMGLNRKQADTISPEQEEILWQKGILGTDAPRELLDTLIYSLGLNFALRAGQEHRNLRVGKLSQIHLHTSTSEQRRYLEYTEDVSKTNAGGLRHRNIKPKTTRAYENMEKPERCIVKLYELYDMSKRPTNGKNLDFYLRPKKKFIQTEAWYDDVPVGIHSLQQTVARLCKDAGFVGNFTNHSLRATAATRLFEEGVDEQLISEKTGHRSNAVRDYKRTSEKLQKDVSDVVQCTKKSKSSPSTETSNMEFKFKGNGMSFHLKF